MLGLSYNNNGEYQKALETLKKALELFPNDISILYCIGIVYTDNNEYQKAIDVFLEIKKIYPKYKDVLERLVDLYKKIGRYDETKKYYKIINQIKAGIEYYNRFLPVKESKKVHLENNVKFIKH